MANTINININKTDLGLNNVDNTSDLNKPISTATQTALNGKENVSNKSTDVNLGTSDTLYPSQKAVKTYTDNLLGNANALIYKGVIDCSTNPNYPSANAGELYVVSVAGKIGGASGNAVEVGDMLICNTDSTASGNQATVGSYWNAIQKNIEGYIIGPASSTNNTLPVFDGATGKLLKNGIITDNGTNIGIGTTTPTTKLEVDGTYKFGPAGGILFGGYGAGTNLDMTALNNGGWTGSSKITTSDSNGTVFFGAYGSDTSLISSHWTIGSSSSSAGQELTTGIHLLKNGHVGIGITTPTAKLHVGGTSYFSNNLELNPNSKLWSLNVSGYYINLANQGTNTLDINGFTGIRLLTGTSSEKMRISSNGDVGIGLSIPTARLHVNNTNNAINSFLVEDDSNPDSTPFVITNVGDVGIGTDTPATKLDVNGNVKIQTIANATSDTDKFLVSDSGVVKYRTGAELLSDINGTSKDLTLDRKTASYTLVANDNGKMIEMNVASANTLTINASLFSAGNQILISQYGAGQTTITAGAGVTLRSSGGKLKTSAQYSLVTIVAISSTEFYVAGDLTA